MSGEATADFIADDGKLHQGVTIVNGLELNDLSTDNRFYKLTDEANDNKYIATASDFTTIGGYAPQSNKTASGGNLIGLAALPNTSTTSRYFAKAPQMRIISVPFDASTEPTPIDRGTNFEVLSPYELVVAIYAEDEVKVVFAFKEDIGRNDLAGIGGSLLPTP